MERFTTIDLLDKIIEFERRWPEQEEWNTSAIDPQDLSRLIRMQRIEALAKAFLPDISLKLTLSNLMNCLLANSKDNIVLIRLRRPGEICSVSYTINPYGWHNEYQTLIQDISDDVNTMIPGNQYDWSRAHLDVIYNDLLVFKKNLDRLFTAGGIYLEGTPTATYGADVAYSISKGIKKLISEEFPRFHRVIGRCINPQEQTFGLEELIENYGYPDFDIEDYEFDSP